MQFVALISWWYSAGWRDQASLVGERLARVADRYSIELLAGSLFAPFRQIDAGGTARGSLEVKLRAWLDRQISRFIGALIRSVMIVAGIIAFLLSITFGVIWLVIWPFIPVLPVIGLVLASAEWMPWSSYV